MNFCSTSERKRKVNFTHYVGGGSGLDPSHWTWSGRHRTTATSKTRSAATLLSHSLPWRFSCTCSTRIARLDPETGQHSPLVPVIRTNTYLIAMYLIAMNLLIDRWIDFCIPGNRIFYISYSILISYQDDKETQVMFLAWT